MVIDRSTAWGHPGQRPGDIPVADNDAELAGLVTELRALDPTSPPAVSVSAGDLLRTLGGSEDPRAPRPVDHWWYPLDLGWVKTDRGDEVPFAAHVLAHRLGWRGEFAVVMNAAWLGRLYLGPRAHPNDGLLDVTVGSLPLRQRIEARRRAATGTHLPHPSLRTARTPRWEHTFAHPIRVFADGENLGLTRSITVRAQTDAYWIVL